jgi:BNR-Asp box repeat
MSNLLLLGTRKGLVIYEKKNNVWQFRDIHFMGIPVSIAFQDERTHIWWACLDHGHWGVKLHRSKDHGKNWEELSAPKFPEGYEIKPGVPASVKYLWAMSHGGLDKSNRLWLGTEPGGLFVSHDGGERFELVESLWQHPSRQEGWFGGGRDYPGIHSILVDPRDSDHLYIGISCAGVFETKDAGATWMVRNKGLRADFLPDPFADMGHDPHILLACAKHPDVLWQQNHCGIFNSHDGGQQWNDVTDKNGGAAKFGFAMAIDNHNPARAWVAPSVSDEVRVAIGNSLCICRTDDGGESWKTFREGLPQEACFDIVYRHALANSGENLAFGTTCGNLFVSADFGESWKAINNYLPMIYSVAFAS